ncbi:MAG: DUF5082 family protein [Catonella sp.]|nr:DUF5082 family protein [Catonella sp.]MDY6356837.1 DUF5082 family protein [Catonella sp.]
MSEVSIDSLYDEKSSTESKISAEEAHKDGINDRITRLKTANNKLSDVKSSIKSLKLSYENHYLDIPGWTGTTDDIFIEKCVTVGLDADAYYNKVDELMDTVNLKIAELKNELIGSDNIISELRRLCNEIVAQIENALN